jgi:homoserine dehydrogenase
VLERLSGYRVLTARRGDDPVSLAGSGVDVVIELMGGLEPAATAIRAALLAGSHVITANKTVIAECGAVFAALAAARGVRLLYSAAVGGGVPVLRTLRALTGRVTRVDGVLNGTTNFVLDRLAEGVPWPAAIAAAQRRGFAEADPTRDLDGTDAAEKITIVARHAFGRGPDDLVREGITPATRGRLVASCWRDGDLVRASVRPCPGAPPFSWARNEENVVAITHDDGRRLVLWGKGAGRDPTASAVLRDLQELSGG